MYHFWLLSAMYKKEKFGKFVFYVWDASALNYIV